MTVFTTPTPTSSAPAAPTPRTTRLAALSVSSAALLAIAGFTALGSVFSYPQILQEPVGAILAQFREHQVAVMGWFAVLVVSAALLAPAGVLIGRLVGGTAGRWVAVVGVAGAVVQVAGLQRWLTIVPGLSRAALDPSRYEATAQRFTFWHTLLGTAIGETLGYVLTAAFTVLVVAGLRRTVLPRWLAIVGYAAAGLIATGVLVPLVHLASLTNFAGYVLWCLWLLTLAVLLVRSRGSRSVAG